MVSQNASAEIMVTTADSLVEIEPNGSEFKYILSTHQDLMLCYVVQRLRLWGHLIILLICYSV